MTASAIDAMAGSAKVCPQLHLPVQSGSSAVLERMERGYSVEQYLDLVERLRARVPGIALSTDVIVGFPGESERDFDATVYLMRAVRFDSAFMFKYSRREHTKAGKWKRRFRRREGAPPAGRDRDAGEHLARDQRRPPSDRGEVSSRSGAPPCRLARREDGGISRPRCSRTLGRPPCDLVRSRSRTAPRTP